MWPFTKKSRETTALPEITVNTVISIPVFSKNINEIGSTIFAGSNGSFMVVGEMIFSQKADCFYKFEISDRDESLAQSFSALGKLSRISEQGLQHVEKHNYVVRISGKTGSLGSAYKIALATTAVLNAGGAGVRIDTAGKAFEKQKWLKYLINFVEADLFEMFTVNSLVDENKNVFSCGMHNLGLKDTLVSGEEFQKAVDLINVFGYYQVFEKPVLLPGQTFQPDLESSKYLIAEVHNMPYPGDSLFANPYGMWRLAAV